MIITTGLSNLTQQVETSGEDMDRAALTSTAVKLLPLLFKIVSTRTASSSSKDDADKDSHAVSSAIASLCRHAPSEFLFGLFKKLMQRLLEEIQSSTNSSEKVCALLSLAQALVASRVLDDANASFLYRVLKPLLRADVQEARVQKRTYKVLAELCECHHAYFSGMQQLKELLALLTDASQSPHVSARYMRLKCLNVLVDGFDDTHTKEVVSSHVDDAHWRIPLTQHIPGLGGGAYDTARGFGLLEGCECEKQRCQQPVDARTGRPTRASKLCENCHCRAGSRNAPYEVCCGNGTVAIGV